MRFARVRNLLRPFATIALDVVGAAALVAAGWLVYAPAGLVMFGVVCLLIAWRVGG